MARVLLLLLLVPFSVFADSEDDKAYCLTEAHFTNVRPDHPQEVAIPLNKPQSLRLDPTDVNELATVATDAGTTFHFSFASAAGDTYALMIEIDGTAGAVVKNTDWLGEVKVDGHRRLRGNLVLTPAESRKSGVTLKTAAELEGSGSIPGEKYYFSGLSADCVINP